MVRADVGEAVKHPATEDFLSLLLELRFYCEIYREPLKDFEQEFQDHIYVLERL